MHKKIDVMIATCAVVAAASALHATLRAQARSLADGVYTEAQAKRGATLYAEQCASCHAEDMTGIPDLFPALVGDTFTSVWQGRSLGELFDKISTTMPALDPGLLKPEQVADIVADILNVGKHPAGTTELPSSIEPLQDIKIEAPKK